MAEEPVRESGAEWWVTPRAVGRNAADSSMAGGRRSFVVGILLGFSMPFMKTLNRALLHITCLCWTCWG
jgi:hypothetical protein